MKFNFNSNDEDFFVFYFSQIFFKKEYIPNIVYKYADILSIEPEKIQSFDIKEEEKKDFLLRKDLVKYNDYLKIKNQYQKIEISSIEKFLKDTEPYKEKYLYILSGLFNSDISVDEITVYFIKQIVDNAFIGNDAFTNKFLINKIFFCFDEEQYKINNFYFIETLLHEMTHIYINNLSEFQNIMKKEWLEKYKNINPTRYRNTIEELIVSSLVFPAKSFGFVFKELNFPENIENKNLSLDTNKYRKFVYVFLENLKQSNDRNKLEKYLPILLSEIINNGIFEK